MEFEWSVNEVVGSVAFCPDPAHKDLLAYSADNKIVIVKTNLPAVSFLFVIWHVLNLF